MSADVNANGVTYPPEYIWNAMTKEQQKQVAEACAELMLTTVRVMRKVEAVL